VCVCVCVPTDII